MEHQERPDRHQLCAERGVSPYEPGYKKLATYASIGEWLLPQFQRKTGFPVSTLGYSVMADINILGAYFDNSTDTNQYPDWHRTYEQAIFPDTTPSKLVVPKIGPPDLTSKTHEDLSALPEENLERISGSWNQLVLSMFDHKCAVMGGSSISGIVATRVAEAVSLADLYTSIMVEDLDDYLYASFYDWLSVQIAAGNLIDTLVDQKEDRSNGHVALGVRDNVVLSGVAATYTLQYFNHPMTEREDIVFMVKKFGKHFLLPLLKASSSSRRVRST